MKKLLPVLAFLCCFAAAHSQAFLSLDDDKKYIDSLVHIIKTTPSDSIKCLNNFRLSELFLRAGNPEKATQYLKEANALKAKSPFLNDAGIYYNAFAFYIKGDMGGHEKALLEANNKLKKYDIAEAYRLRAIALPYYSILQQSKNSQKGYMDILVNKALPVAKRSGNNEIISRVYRDIATICMNIDERKKAGQYFGKAVEYIDKADKRSPTFAESQIYTYILEAENLSEMKEFDKAKKLLDKVSSKLSHYPESNLNAIYFCAEGIYYARQKQWQRALKSYEKGIRSATKDNDKLSIERLKSTENEVLYELKNFEKVKNNLFYLLKNKPLTIDRMNHYDKLAKIFSITGDYKNAFLYANKYNVLNDSLNATKFQNDIVELEAKYNKVENEKKITLLQSQNQKVALEAKNSRLSLGLFGLLSILLLLTVAFLWKSNQNQKKLSTQKEINYQQTVTTLENQRKLSVSHALLEGEEAERKRIARDLHDGLGSMLSGFKMHFNTAVKDIVPNSNELNALLDKSITELRTISQNLMPEALLQLGLEHALKDLCLSLATPKNRIEFQYLAADSHLPQYYEIAIYRIIQELLNNALKYANASEILVACSQNQDTFFITVEDNGVGFDTAEMGSFKGMGLKNIQNRVAFFEGKVEFNAAKGKGTAVYIELKIKEKPMPNA